jgi:RNA polymerase sigma-70 factor (ECF subfamily)
MRPNAPRVPLRKRFMAGSGGRSPRSSSSETSARQPTPSALVELARAGDSEAFSELMRRYRPNIYALALHLTGDAHDADDIAQDTFLRAYKSLVEFRAESEFYTWIYRIALNLSLNVQRRNVRRRAAPLDDPRVTLAVQVDAHGDPRRAAELRQIYTRLVAALDALSVPLRSAVVLVSIHGLSHDQAAQILSCSTGTVAWRIHRARTKLAAALRPAPRSGRQEDDSGSFFLPRFGVNWSG